MSFPAAGSGTILTVTLNLALDVTYVADGVDWDGVNRVRSVHRRAGGKGVNVARVLAALGRDVLVTGLAGGPNGRAAEADLSAAGLPAALTPIAAESRATLAVCDPAPLPYGTAPAGPVPGGPASDGTAPEDVAPARTAGPRTALFNEPGPVVTEAELDDFLRGYDRRLGAAAAVVISGSLPPGVPAGFYAELAARARGRGVPAIVDADGEPLRAAPAGRPAVLKPNAEELARALSAADLRAPGGAPETGGGQAGGSEAHGTPAGVPGTGHAPITDALAGAGVLRRDGAESVVVSLGADGLLAVTPEGAWRAAMPYRVAGNPTGAGDALVAGLALGLVEGTPWPDRLRRAAALGAAAVAAPVAGDFDEETFRRVRPGIRVDPVGP
ncbi:1-phosphofructokinase family hexose kinase [Streptosporangium pseudovulgare]|uniref:1-phosphofructokinase n=1 Tax=Streptosporangium pseudovulgare TaxID=35765 RepID=A0ABQ2QT82_9ACTN|nr:PfkB family carbohydrate kinase [Streptosporangium pseudovulgare]GGP95282.1 1-phosphofructokinase [Streptosporangium pseudovulgare]